MTGYAVNNPNHVKAYYINGSNILSNVVHALIDPNEPLLPAKSPRKLDNLRRRRVDKKIVGSIKTVVGNPIREAI